MSIGGMEKFTEEVLATIEEGEMSRVPISIRRTIMYNLSSTIFLRKILQTVTPELPLPKVKSSHNINSFIKTQLKIIEKAAEGTPLSIISQLKYQLLSQLPPEAKKVEISTTTQLLDGFSDFDAKSLAKITEEIQSIDWITSTIGEVKSDQQSSIRRITGSYYTPEVLVEFSLKQSLDPHLKRLTKNRGRESIQKLTICDPACGSGAFLLAVASRIAHKKKNKIMEKTHAENFLEVFRTQIFGADLNPIALFSLAVQAWMLSGRPELNIGELLANFRSGNSLLWCKEGSSEDRDSSSARFFFDESMSATEMEQICLENGIFHWDLEFSEIFLQGGFDIVVGNPPWERKKIQLREFLRPYENLLSQDVTKKKERKKLREKILEENPYLKKSYEDSQLTSKNKRNFLIKSGEYPLTGSGDVNLYSVFAELSQYLVRSEGLVSLIVPTKIATGHNNRKFFETLITERRLMTCLDIENKKLFKDIHSHTRFSVLSFKSVGSEKLRSGPMVSSMLNGSQPETWKNGLIRIKWGDFERFNPNSMSIILPSTKEDYDLLSIAYANCPILWRGFP